MRDWWYAEGAEARGPISEEELEHLLRTSALSRKTLVWDEGAESWVPASQFFPPQPVAPPPTPPKKPRWFLMIALAVIVGALFGLSLFLACPLFVVGR